MLEMAIGAMARNEKCLMMASWANTIPAIGAPKPAEIAPATPQPMNTSIEKIPPVTRRNRLPITPPKCTSGPYWPTEAPPLAEINAAKVEANPFLWSSWLSGICAA